MRPKASFLPRVAIPCTLIRASCSISLQSLGTSQDDILLHCLIVVFEFISKLLLISIGLPPFLSFLKVPVRNSLPLIPLILGGLGRLLFHYRFRMRVPIFPVGHTLLDQWVPLGFCSGICFSKLQGFRLVFSSHVYYCFAGVFSGLFRCWIWTWGISGSSWSASSPSVTLLLEVLLAFFSLCVAHPSAGLL